MKQVTTENNQCMVSGPLTFDTIISVTNQFKPLLPSDAKFIVNFSKVTKCDSASLAFITGILREAKQRKLDIHFIGVPDQLSNLIRVGGLDSILPISQL